MAIDLYYWPTPNGRKVSIMLEELGLDYQVLAVDITAGEQFNPEFLSLSPNNKIPVIVDTDGPGGEPVSVFESGAILLYLAEKSGRLLPDEPRARLEVLQWLMFQMGGIGPMLGQAHHFRGYAPKPIEYAIDRYTNEAARLYGVLDERLAKSQFLAGDYSIADIATFPWIMTYRRQGQDLCDFAHVERWFTELQSRPAVQRGIELLQDLRRSLEQMDGETRENMFGERQWRRRSD